MTIEPLLVLDRALRDAGIPIYGVSMGNLSDRSTWIANYQPSATLAQRAQGDALLLSTDTQDAGIVAEIKADLALQQVDSDVLTSMAQALWEAIPAPLLTKVQLRARFIAILKTK